MMLKRSVSGPKCACRRKRNGRKLPGVRMAASGRGAMSNRLTSIATLIEMLVIQRRSARIRLRVTVHTNWQMLRAMCGSGRRTGLTASITQNHRPQPAGAGERQPPHVARGLVGQPRGSACAAPIATSGFQAVAMTMLVSAWCPPAQLIAETSDRWTLERCSLAGVPGAQRPGYEYRRQPVADFVTGLS